MNQQQTLRLALEALKNCRVMADRNGDGVYTKDVTPKFITEATQACQQALAEPQVQGGRTVDAAEKIGAKGAPATESERLLFEAWMKGHCWKVEGNWDGKQYVHESETIGIPHAGAMRTRQLWAAWRDSAALGSTPPASAQAWQPIETAPGANHG